MSHPEDNVQNLLTSIFKFKKSKEDFYSLIFWRDVACEFMVANIFMILATLILINNSPAIFAPDITHFGLFAGLFVYLLLEGYGSISCVLNPMISFCLFVAGKISFVKMVMFHVAQVGGCIGGSWVGYGLVPAWQFNGTNPYQAFDPITNHGLTHTQAVFVEALLSFNLVFVVMNLHGSDFQKKHPVLPNLAIGLIIGTSLMAAGTFTGGFMNPLVSLGPAVLARNMKNHWIYWVGPYVGGIPAVFVYKLFALIQRRSEMKSSKTLQISREAIQPVVLMNQKTPNCPFGDSYSQKN